MKNLHPLTTSVIRLGTCMGMCRALEFTLPPSAKQFFKNVERNTPLDEIDETEVWTAIRDMVKMVDDLHGEGFSQRELQFSKDEIERISSILT